MLNVLAQATGGWDQPTIDVHALLPEFVLAGVFVIVILADLFLEERRKWATSSLAGLGLLGAFVPVLTLAVDGADRAMFGGAYVVDDFSLFMKGLFLLATYVVVLIGQNYVEEGDYYQGEYYTLLLSSVLGMMMISSSRDLISLFIALEFLSIPAYMLAAWRKRDGKSNEAGVKYYLLGVFSSAVMLYGMSLVYGVTGTTVFTGIADAIGGNLLDEPIVTLGIVFVIVGFAFKVSAVPFHSWAPDTYEGAPTPITAFLSVASKAAGFVGLLSLVFVAFRPSDEVWEPLFWVLAALSMTVGNMVALRQTNIVRMLAYSSVAQGGYILMPLAVVGESSDAARDALLAVITYLAIYTAMNLGAFGVIIAVARKTRSGEISSFGGLFTYAPGLCVAMTIFLMSLAGIPPLGGWVAKFAVFRALVSAGGAGALTLAAIGAVNSVIAVAYYLKITRAMWFNPAPDGDTTPIRVNSGVGIALGLCVLATLAMGVVPQVLLRFSDLSGILAAAG